MKKKTHHNSADYPLDIQESCNQSFQTFLMIIVLILIIGEPNNQEAQTRITLQ